MAKLKGGSTVGGFVIETVKGATDRANALWAAVNDKKTVRVVAADTDLNTLTEYGEYIVRGTTTAGNKPVTNFGALLVFNSSGSVRQLYVVDNSSVVYSRTMNTTSNAWTAWTELKFTDTVYTLPAATASVLGGVKNGTNISNSAGTLSVADGTTSVKGVVQLVDGVASTSTALAATGNSVKTVNDTLTNHKNDTTVHITASERTAWNGKASTSAVTTSANGLMSAADKSKLDGIATGANNYTLPTATASVLGGVKNGTNISNSAGTLSVADASTSTKGVVQLVDSVTSTSTTLAPTANALKTARDALTTHTNNTTVHITSSERNRWDSKMHHGMYDAIVKGSAWCRVMQFYANNGQGHAALVTLRALRPDVNYSVTFLVRTNVDSVVANRGSILVLAHNAVSPVLLRLAVNENGDGFLEMFDSNSGLTASQYGLVQIDFQPLIDSTIYELFEYTATNEEYPVITSIIAGGDIQPVVSGLVATDRVVSTTYNGLMSIADKTKLNGIATGANNYTLPTATASVLGGVKNGTNISNSAGTLSVADGTTSVKGVVQLSDSTSSTSTTLAATANAVRAVAASRATISSPIFSGHLVVGTLFSDANPGTPSMSIGSNNYVGQPYAMATGMYNTIMSRGGVAQGEYNYAGIGTAYIITGRDTTAKTLTLDKVTGLSVGDTVDINITFYPQIHRAKVTSISGLVIGLDEADWTTAANWYACIRRGTSTSVAVAFGSSSVATANGSTAGGYRCVASGSSSTALGSANVASGQGSAAFCSGNTASASFAMAVGTNTEASGLGALSTGGWTEASGYYSSAFGLSTVAPVHGSFAVGRYNKLMTGNINYIGSTGDLFVVGNGTNTNALSNALRVTVGGNVLGTSAFGSTGADYAEYFEWADGNEEDEDRVGYVVSLIGEEIIKSSQGDNILGIISATPSFTGDAYEDDWVERYMLDEWGRRIEEEFEYEQANHVPVDVFDEILGETRVQIIEVMETVTGTRFKHNPDWNHEQEYIPRSKRKEWAVVGLVGKLLARTDGTLEVGDFAQAGNDGKLTKSDTVTNIQVMKVVNERIVKVFVK